MSDRLISPSPCKTSPTEAIDRDPILSAAGFFIFIGAQVEDQGIFFQSVVDTVQMREVMLTDFATLSPSDTLADALIRCVHSLQEDFPVVRGSQLVGIVNRQRAVPEYGQAMRHLAGQQTRG